LEDVTARSLASTTRKRFAAQVREKNLAFEVQVSGNLESALGKLNMAHNLWNSRVILVTESETVEKAGYLLENTFPAIDDEARLLTVEQVRALHRRKTDYYELETELGLT